jgi:hypothetical protein
MAKEVRILSSWMHGEKWPNFEHAIAAKLNAGWTVSGFTALRDPDHGDIVYVLLERETSSEKSRGESNAKPDVS